MGAMKQLFTDLQDALERGDWMELMLHLDQIDQEVRAQWLLDTVTLMASIQEQGYYPAKDRVIVCARCKTPVTFGQVSAGYFATCPQHDEDLFEFETENQGGN